MNNDYLNRQNNYSMKKTFLFALLIVTTTILSAQTSLQGKITDEDTGEELFGANVVAMQEGALIAGVSADLDGNYSIQLDPGTYDIEVSYLGLPTKKVKGVVIKAGQANKLDVALGGDAAGINLDMVIVTEYKVPLIEQDNTTSCRVITQQDIQNLPTKDVRALAATAAGLKSADGGDGVTVHSTRGHATDYYIDGIRVRNSKGLIPQSEIEQTNEFPIEWQPRDPNATIRRNQGVPAAFADDWEQTIWEQENTLERLERRLPPAHDPIDFREEYTKIVENTFVRSVNEPYSTFSIDVDRAAYAIVRRDIRNGQQPADDVARTEEMVNYFNYDYPQPQEKVPFAIYTELGECPWNKTHQLLHVGLQGEKMRFEETEGSNLVFLIDVSGSMTSSNKLSLLKPAFKLLVDQLREKDKVSIVVYAGAAGLVLPPTSAKDKATIRQAIDQLSAGGSTAGGAGINLAYKIAKENFVEGGNNRVILATDGDFNVGVSSQGGLKKLIEEKRKDGIFLTVLGFGMGNLKDNRLETLADSGNGNYAYIDDLKEAKRVFVNELPGTLYTIAKDVKIQMIFNPRLVKSYRLIGYENRLLAKRDFDDDTKDAGELGAGHTVTALYEIVPTHRSLRIQDFPTDPVEEEKGGPSVNEDAPGNSLVTIRLRYKAPDEEQSQLIAKAVHPRHQHLKETSDNFRFSAAVASFSLLLRNSKYKGDTSCKSVLKLANGSKGNDFYGYREEFIELVKTYKEMSLISRK